MDDLLRVLDYFGVVVFAISGALTAARKGMDLVGFALIGTVTGIGGGTLFKLGNHIDHGNRLTGRRTAVAEPDSASRTKTRTMKRA